MPLYNVEDPETGVKLQLEGDSPPSEQELEQIFSQYSKQDQRSNLITDPVETIKRSGGEFFGGIAEAVSHPVQTAQSLGNLAIGVAQKLYPGEQDKEKYADAVGQFFVDRYGSLDKVKQTALEDPVGFAADLSMAVTGVGGAVTKAGMLGKAGKAGQLGKLGNLAKTGRIISRAGKAIDPATIATKMIGTGVREGAKTIGKVAPFAGSLDNPVIKAAERLKVELPASAKTKSRAVPLLEAAAGKGLFGKRVVEKVENAKKALVNIGEEVINKTKKADDLGQAGEAIKAGAERFRQRFFDVKEILYENAGFNKEGKLITITPDKAKEAINFIDTILENKQKAQKVLGKSTSKNLFAKIKKALQGKKVINKGKITDVTGKPLAVSSDVVYVDATDIKAALDELNNDLFNSTDPVITGNKATLKKLAATLADDLDQAIITENPALAERIQRANRFYKLGLEELNSHFGEVIYRLKDQPDKILPAILKNTTSESDVRRIYRLIGKDNVSQVQTAFMRKFLEGAKNADGTAFTPQGLVNQVKRFGDNKLRKVLTPEQYSKVKDMSTVAQSIGKYEKIAGGSQTAFTGRILYEFSPLFSGDVLTTTMLLAGDKIGSSFIGSDLGQRLLSQGVELTGATGQKIINQANRARNIGRAGRLTDIVNDGSL